MLQPWHAPAGRIPDTGIGYQTQMLCLGSSRLSRVTQTAGRGLSSTLGCLVGMATLPACSPPWTRLQRTFWSVRGQTSSLPRERRKLLFLESQLSIRPRALEGGWMAGLNLSPASYIPWFTGRQEDPSSMPLPTDVVCSSEMYCKPTPCFRECHVLPPSLPTVQLSGPGGCDCLKGLQESGASLLLILPSYLPFLGRPCLFPLSLPPCIPRHGLLFLSLPLFSFSASHHLLQEALVTSLWLR